MARRHSMADTRLSRHRHDQCAHARSPGAAPARAGHRNLAVLERIRNVPRHLFVDEALGSRAYEDTALPIGFGQTISQPYIVARMTEALLEGGAVDKVLEVGTGCGYQTAVLAPLVDASTASSASSRCSMRARERLKELGIRNVRFRTVTAAWAGRHTRPSMASSWRPRRSRVPEALIEAAEGRRAPDRARRSGGRAGAAALYPPRAAHRTRGRSGRSPSCRCSAESPDFSGGSMLLAAIFMPYLHEIYPVIS